MEDRTFLSYIPVVSFEGGVQRQSPPLAFHANLSLKSHMTLYELFNLCPVASFVKWVYVILALPGSRLNQCNGLHNACTE